MEETQNQTDPSDARSHSVGSSVGMIDCRVADGPRPWAFCRDRLESVHNITFSSPTMAFTSSVALSEGELHLLSPGFFTRMKSDHTHGARHRQAGGCWLSTVVVTRHSPQAAGPRHPHGQQTDLRPGHPRRGPGIRISQVTKPGVARPTARHVRL